jgi:4-diphosphocytidyl-2-C-methyl-D-erythritol kinase
MSTNSARAGGFAAAKVNLFLHVGPLAEDGYHPIASLMVFADIGDRVWLNREDSAALTMEGPFAASLAADADNLALRAAAALAPDACIGLDKALPLAAGLGGGSADAAAVLRLLNARRPEPLPSAKIARIAANLGADVAACLESRPVLATGRGDQLAPAPALPALHAVLVNPLAVSPTAAVYRAFDVGGARASADLPPLPDCFSDVQALVEVLAKTRNDLEAPAITLAPAIEAALEALHAAPETLMARVSGSGATSFALTADAAGAEVLAARLARRYPTWWVKACRLGGPWG